jgi:hypothetical protein
MMKKYDSTVARIAGDIMSSWPTTVNATHDETIADLARQAVRIARAIVSEVERTEIPKENAEVSPLWNPR